jgi:hypothetical protein
VGRSQKAPGCASPSRAACRALPAAIPFGYDRSRRASTGETRRPIHTTCEEKASLREVLAEVTEALRHYVVQVSATVRRKSPKTAERAAKLLAPITEWQRPGGKAKGAGEPESPPEPPPAPQAS